MIVKLTLRLPEPVVERLREHSREQGRSLNETAVGALVRGLGGAAEAWEGEAWRVLGPLVEAPPSAAYDAGLLRRLRGELSPGARGVLEELEWVRGPR